MIRNTWRFYFPVVFDSLVLLKIMNVVSDNKQQNLLFKKWYMIYPQNLLSWCEKKLSRENKNCKSLLNYLEKEITFYKASDPTEDFISVALKYSYFQELKIIEKCWKGSEFTLFVMVKLLSHCNHFCGVYIDQGEKCTLDSKPLG